MTRVLVMSTHVCPDGDTEAEPVLVETNTADVTLLLDDGTVISFDRDELTAAIVYDEQRAAA